MRLLSPKELADMYFVTPTTIREWMKLGMPYHGTGKMVVFDFDAVKQWISTAKDQVGEDTDFIDDLFNQYFYFEVGAATSAKVVQEAMIDACEAEGITWQRVAKYLRDRGATTTTKRVNGKPIKVWLRVSRK